MISYFSDNIKNKLMRALLALTGILCYYQVIATHIIGGEISYQCLGNNRYKILLDVYRDCYYGQAEFDQPARVAIFNDANQLVTTMALSIMESDTIPNNILDAPCLFIPPDICVEKAHYEGTVTLTGAGGYHIVYQRCCRNGTISNIVNPIEAGATYSVYLSPASKQLCNSSPSFGFVPPVFVCVNRPFSHPHSAKDLDGDSLVYKFYTPNTGGAISDPQPLTASPPPYTQVTWLAPRYSLNNLLGSGTPLAIDSKTGQITALPTTSGQYVVGVQVEEYRNGVLLSVVSRDLQYNVGICSEIIPGIIAPEAQCDNQTVAFKNNTTVATHFNWYFNWPDTIAKSNLKEPVYTYPDTGRFVVALVAEPGNQCQAVAFDTIFLQSNSLTADYSVEITDCTAKSVLVLKDLSRDSISPPVSWSWEVKYGTITLTSDSQNPVFQIPNPSSGTISLRVKSKNGCQQVLTRSFSTGNNNPVNVLPKQLDVCYGTSIHLNPNYQASGFFFNWDHPVPPSQRNLPNPLVSPLETTNYAVTITGFNGLCESFGIVRVNVIPLPVLDFQDQLGCDARVVKFKNTSQFSPSGFRWNFGDPNSSNDTSSLANPIYTYPNYGPYIITLSTAPNAFCKDTIFKTVTINEKILKAGFSYEYTNCSENEVTVSFKDQTINNLQNTKSWHWQFSGVYSGTSSLQNPNISVANNGELIVRLSVITQDSCISSTDSIRLNIEITKLPGLTTKEILGCLSGGVVLNTNGNPKYKYKWSPAIGLSCTNCADPSESPSPLANPPQSTSYTVVVMNVSADTCILTRTIDVIVPREPGLSASNDTNTCEPSLQLSAATVLQPITLEWFENNQKVGAGNTLNVNVSGTNIYTVRATDQYGCQYFKPIKVSGGPVDIAVSGQQLICNNEPLNVGARNLDPNDTLIWKWTPSNQIIGPADVPNPAVLKEPGERVLQLEATNQFGCIKNDSIYVAVVDDRINLDFDFQVGCSGSVVSFNNKSQFAYKYVWDFGDLLSTNDTSSEVNPQFTYSANGTYQVMLTIGLDVICRDTIIKEIIITDPEFTPSFRYEYIECNEDSIDIQFFDSSVNFLNNTNSWLWKTSTGLTSTQQNPVFRFYAGQDFTITMTIGTPNNCEGSKTETLKLNFIKVNLPDTVTMCLGDSLALNPSGDTKYAYLWNGGNLKNSTLPNPRVSPTQTTTYEVSITSFTPDTCTIFKKITVFVPPKLELTTSKDTFTCGELVTLQAFSNINPTSFQWIASPGGLVGTSPSLQLTPAIDTRYKVIGTDKYGCTAEASVFVANESLHVGIQEANQRCPEENIAINILNEVTDHRLNFSWYSSPAGNINPPLNGQSVIARTPAAGQTAIFSADVSNQFGCRTTLSKTITAHSFSPIVTTSILACPDVSVALNPGADPSMTYKWNPGTGLTPGDNVPNPSVTLNKSAIYNVTISKGYGDQTCQRSFSVNVNVPPLININETVDTFTCGVPISIGAQTNVPTTLQWFNKQGTLVGNGPTLIVNPEDSNVFTVKATDASNCFATDTVNVSNNQLDLQVDGDGIIDICPESSYQICVTNKDPRDILSYKWTASGGGQILSGGNTACPSVSSVQGLTVLFTAEVSNQWGCKATKSVNLTTYVFNPVIRGVVTVCPNIETPINPGGNPNLKYTWTPQVGLSCYDCPNPVAKLNKSQQYVATVQGFNGADTCSLVQTVQVRVNEPIGLKTVPTDTVICSPTDLLLRATVTSPIAKSFVWSLSPEFSNPIGNSAQVLVRPSGTQSYYVMASDTLGCKEIAEFKVTSAPVNVSVTPFYNYCKENGTLRIPVVNNNPNQKLTYQWSPTNVIKEVQADGSIIVDIQSNTVFYLNTSNQFGCKDLDSTRIAYYDIGPTIKKISSSRDTIIYNSGQFSQLDVLLDPTYTYKWTPQAGLSNPNIHNPKASPAETTTYTLQVTNIGNCTLERKVTIVVINPDCSEANIFIPNAFSPNGDGRNDVLYVRSNIIDDIEFAVYNRWGQKVFETKDKTKGWDGTFKGKTLSPDVYGYYLKAKCFNGDEFFKKGNVTLLK